MAENAAAVSRQTALMILRLQSDVERQLRKAEEWVFRQQCKRAGMNYRPRRRFKPNLEKIKQLSREIRGLPARKRLSARQAGIYIETLLRLRGRQERLEFLVAKALHAQASWRSQTEGRVRRTFRLLGARDEVELLARLLGGDNGSNVHARALGKLARWKSPLTHKEAAERGRRGARVRWQRERERRQTAASE